jgi:hypothetical protein
MKTFKDNVGREWSVSIDPTSIKRVRERCGVDLAKATANNCELIGRLHDDLLLLADVTYALVKPEADKANVTDGQFDASMTGDAFAGAFEAIIDGLCLFLPNPRVRDGLRLYVGKMTQAVALIQTQAELAVRSLDVEAALKDGGLFN